MKTNACKFLAGVCLLGMVAVWTAPAGAQMTPVKEKPPMYSYIANWQIPRAQWAAMQKSMADDGPTFEKGIADGTIVGYGSDETRVHTAEGETHDDWWSAMSMAGILNMLDRLYKAGAADSPALESATKHWDNVYVSRYYNWHPGAYKGAYTYVSFYNLKPNAPDGALDSLSKNLIAPILEKVLASGAVVEWEVDTQALDTESPNEFLIVYVCPDAEGIDKVETSVQEALRTSPLLGPSFFNSVDMESHRNELLRTDLKYK